MASEPRGRAGELRAVAKKIQERAPWQWLSGNFLKKRHVIYNLKFKGKETNEEEKAMQRNQHMY